MMDKKPLFTDKQKHLLFLVFETFASFIFCILEQPCTTLNAFFSVKIYFLESQIYYVQLKSVCFVVIWLKISIYIYISHSKAVVWNKVMDSTLKKCEIM